MHRPIYAVDVLYDFSFTLIVSPSRGAVGWPVSVFFLYFLVILTCMLIQTKLEYAATIWSPFSKTQIQLDGPAKDGETRVVSATCLMSLSGHLLRP